MGNKQENVWFASPDRILRRFKWCLYDDVGLLEWTKDGSLLFTGKRQHINCAKPITLSLIRQPIPWFAIILSAGLLVAAVSSGVMTYFTWQNPVTIPILLGLIGFYFWVAGPVQWVRIDYSDVEGKREIAYFLPAGPSRLFGATRRLYERLQVVTPG